MTEITGPASSGRTSLLHSLLAGMTCRQEYCVLLDATDSFDPEGAAAAGVRLSQVLWVRCGGSVERALKAADLLAHGGGFGLVAIDLANAPEKDVRRIPMAAWFRLRNGVKDTQAALVVISRHAQTRSCSAVKIQLQQNRARWRGRIPGCLFDGLDVMAQTMRNHCAENRLFTVRP